MNKKNKSTIKNNSQNTYNVWKQYSEFIRSLYLERPVKKPTGRELTWKYLKKIAIVFFGALFTTLTFYFLIDPNGIYNSGLNGLLQSASKLIVGRSSKISWGSYYLIYYGLGLLTNLLFIFALRFFFKAKLEIISTSVFYVLSQIIWTQIFSFFRLREYIFNRFNPTSWQGLSIQSQLSFTLPYYIVIAIVAAIIHTYGYSLIFRAQATPGGLEILTSHFSAQRSKKKFSIGAFMKFFGLAIIFLVTLVNFLWIENSPRMKQSNLQKEMLEALDKKSKEKTETEQEQIAEIKKGEIETTLGKWKKDMEQVRDLEEKSEKEDSDIKKIFELKKKNLWLTSLLKNKIGEPELEKYPQEAEYYLESDKKKIIKLEEEKGKVEKQLSESTGKKLEEKLERKNVLEQKLAKLEEKEKQGGFARYLIYISNNERLWATMVYIFLSAFLISQIFPRDQIVLLRLYSSKEENRNKGLKLLAKFSPIYYTVYRRKGENQEEVIFVTNCHLSKWNYYLLTPYLKQVGTTYIYETS